ncbi:protein NRT1/ PTR FAMILY 5.1-like [Arachis stenosperma]|uniref:protein NRT1/ PTR FAMILY 5.1-like n=1 Tax=Arachis stenosperma TaxID=217475 RepID=UPI0025ABF8A1|nr:protein NRT1/ PTR FAMILY 5.1-like [Arachis stenosperma]
MNLNYCFHHNKIFCDMEDKNSYTQDGTVDLRGKRVLSSTTGQWKACRYILAYQALERFAYFGVAANLVNYMTSQLHKDLVSSISDVNNWSGVAWITPILGAYIADSHYMGRFWTVTLSLLIYTIGVVFLVLTTWLKSLRPKWNSNASNLQLSLFNLSLYTIAIGSGALKPNMSTFGADQFDDFNSKEKQLKGSFFNWWTFHTSCGALVATLAVVYIQEKVRWECGYALCAIGFLFSVIVFFLGTPLYRHKSRNAKTCHEKDFIRVILLAFTNRNLQLPTSPSELHEFDLQHYVNSGTRQIHHTPRFRFLDKAAIKESKNAACTVTQVEGTKLVLGMLEIWLLMLIPSNFLAVEMTIFVKQGTTLDRSLGQSFRIPAASLWSFLVVTMLISLPIYDTYFVPFMRRRTGNMRGITLLQRLGAGIAVQAVAMAVCCAVEIQRMNVIAQQHISGHEKIVPMSIFWLLPQYILLGIADTFLMSGLLEFFYDQSPEEMKGLGTTFFTSSVAAGSFLCTFLVTMTDKVTGKVSGKRWIGNNLNDSHLDYYYAFLFVISLLNFGAFLWASSGYTYKKENTLELESPL